MSYCDDRFYFLILCYLITTQLYLLARVKLTSVYTLLVPALASLSIFPAQTFSVAIVFI